MPAEFAGEYGSELFLDLSGDLIPGEEIRIDEPGTSTPATLYTDRTKATAASNPVELSDKSNLHFFADPGPYDAKLMTLGVPGDPVRIVVPPDLEDALNDGFLGDPHSWSELQTFEDGVEVGNNGVKLYAGTGSPESVVTAPVGSLYLRENGGSNTTLYVKQTGSGSTGWSALGTSAASKQLIASHNGALTVGVFGPRDPIMADGTLGEFRFILDESPGSGSAKFDIKLNGVTSIFSSEPEIEAGEFSVDATPTVTSVVDGDYLKYETTQIGTAPSVGYRSGSVVTQIINQAAETGFTLTLPVGYQTNDLLLAFVVTGNTATPSYTIGEGWTNVGPGPTNYAWGVGGTDNHYLTVFWKFATSASETAPTIDCGSQIRATLVTTVAYAGLLQDSTVFDKVEQAQSTTGTAGNRTTGTGTTAVANEVLIAVATAKYAAGTTPGGTNHSDPGGNTPSLTELSDIVTTRDPGSFINFSMAVFDRGQVASAGSQISASTAYANAHERSYNLAIALKPGATGGAGAHLTVKGSVS